MNVESAVLVGVIVLTAALVVGIVAERLRVPYIVALLIVSLPIGPFGSEEDFVHSFLLVLLPALIFEAAWNFNAGGLRRTWPAVAFLAAPGVVLTMTVVAAGLAAAGLVPWLPALLLGAIVAPTDPVTVIASFKRASVPERLAITVEGESLFNDGLGVVAYGALAAALAAGTAISLPLLARDVIVVSLGGSLLGAAIAALVFGVARLATDADLAIVATTVVAYGSYLAAEHVHVSGIFAALVGGITLRVLADRRAERAAVERVDSFWSITGFFANTLVFVTVGARIEIGRIAHEPWVVLLTFGLVLLARAVSVYGVLPFLGVRSRAWQHVVMISGIRGGVSIALALALPHGTPFRDEIVDAVYGVVAATILIQGIALGPLLGRLRL